jgi:hypothetical protein
VLSRYYEFTILWGRSGRDCARKLADEIKRRHEEEYMPVKAFIFEKEALDSSSIMDDVIHKISKSSACIIILTFDDVDGTRVRQNILIETGIAWTLLGKENLLFLSDQREIPKDFPSNIRTNINTNFFDKNDPDRTVQRVCNELIKSRGIHSTKDFLSMPNYTYDGKILDDLEQPISTGKAEVQLRSIIKNWKEAIESFEYLQERIMYVIERVAFFPILGSDDELVTFMKDVKELIVPTALDKEHMQENRSEVLKNSMILTNQIVEYSILKTQPETRQCLKDPFANKRLTEKVERGFGKIYQEIKRVIDDFEAEKNHYNWLIRIVAYDYAALSKMKMFVIDANPTSKENQQDLEEAILYFEKAKLLAKDEDVESGNIWLGFIQYNLSRAYESKYTIKKEAKLISLIKENLLDAIGYREEWTQNEYYKGIFSTALSYEYFLASYYDYMLRYDLKGYSDETPEENLENVKELRNILNHYCDKTELGTLYRMRDQIDGLIEKITRSC